MKYRIDLFESKQKKKFIKFLSFEMGNMSRVNRIQISLMGNKKRNEGERKTKNEIGMIVASRFRMHGFSQHKWRNRPKVTERNTQPIDNAFGMGRQHSTTEVIMLIILRSAKSKKKLNNE